MHIPYVPPMTDDEAQERLDRLVDQWREQVIELRDVPSVEHLEPARETTAA